MSIYTHNAGGNSTIQSGKRMRDENVELHAHWNAKAPAQGEIPFVVARVVLQDFTGVPLLVDLAAMISTVSRLGHDPKMIEPLVPVDLVADHSVQVDFFGSGDALQRNLDLEFQHNRERYELLRWGQQAFKTFGVVPPGIGIVHQVNLEHVPKGRISSGGTLYSDTLVGTDSHTTMINGLGVVGWSGGGIEAEAGNCRHHQDAEQAANAHRQSNDPRGASPRSRGLRQVPRTGKWATSTPPRRSSRASERRVLHRGFGGEKHRTTLTGYLVQSACARGVFTNPIARVLTRRTRLARLPDVRGLQPCISTYTSTSIQAL